MWVENCERYHSGQSSVSGYETMVVQVNFRDSK